MEDCSVAYHNGHVLYAAESRLLCEAQDTRSVSRTGTLLIIRGLPTRLGGLVVMVDAQVVTV